ncbi:MAG TPA: SNF2-related protein, partial [Limnochordales bacterium]
MQRPTPIRLAARWLRSLEAWAVRGPGPDPRAFRLWPCLLQRLEPAGQPALLCLAAMPVRLYPHQRAAVERVVGEMGVRALLADEVGMGKTVEAGAVLKELVMRGRLRRALVLVPAGLVRQWQQELRLRCDLRVCVHPRPDHGWDRDEIVLASLEAARLEPHASAIRAQPWDVVVVDEAHRLKDRQSAGFRLVAGLRKQGLLLLTATPVHNSLDELYNLVSLLRPGQLGTPRRFRAEFTRGPRTPREPARLRQLLDQVMVRTRRQEAGIVLPPREVRSVAVPFTPAERRLYQGLLALLRELGQEAGRGPDALLAATLLREATSCPAALARTLLRLAAAPPGPVWQARRDRIARLAAMAGRAALAGGGPKIRWLVAWLRADRPSAGSVVAFTQFAATARRAARALREAGIEAALVHGAQPDRVRQYQLQRFRSRAPVLVSTDVGSEGHNLQHAWRLVNLDLPWNPMRVEQRIGRLHRLGQSRPVEVVHLLVPGTVEEYLMELIYEKLGMFREVIGDLDQVVAALPGGLAGQVRESVL